MTDLPPTTPILDSGVLPPIRRPNRVVGILIGLGIGILFAGVINNVGSLGPQPGLALVFYFTILGLAVTLHELGHLAAGWMVGFHFSHISLGPVLLRLEYGRLKVKMRPGLGAVGYAGMHIETVKKARRNLFIFAGAGPLANFVSGAIAMLFVHFGSLAYRESWILPYAAGFAVFSFLIGGMSLIPYGATLQSDGARLWMLLRSRERTRRWIATCALGSQQRKGIRPSNWKQTWLRAACSVHDGRIDELSSNLLAYAAASDRKDVPAVASYLERSLDLARGPQPAQRDFIAREASYFFAWFRGDVTLASRWLSQVRRPKITTPLLQIRTEIALDCARNNFENAMTGWKKGAEFIQRLPDTKVKSLLKDSWQEWGEEIGQKEQQAVAQV